MRQHTEGMVGSVYMYNYILLSAIIIYNNIKVPRLSFTREDVEMETRQTANKNSYGAIYNVLKWP